MTVENSTDEIVLLNVREGRGVCSPVTTNNLRATRKKRIS